MTNEFIKAKANDIATMDEDDLYNLGVEIDMSNVGAKSKAILYGMIDDRYEVLKIQRETQGAEVVASELKVGEI